MSEVTYVVSVGEQPLLWLRYLHAKFVRDIFDQVQLMLKRHATPKWPQRAFCALRDLLRSTHRNLSIPVMSRSAVATLFFCVTLVNSFSSGDRPRNHRGHQRFARICLAPAHIKKTIELAPHSYLNSPVPAFCSAHVAIGTLTSKLSQENQRTFVSSDFGKGAEERGVVQGRKMRVDTTEFLGNRRFKLPTWLLSRNDSRSKRCTKKYVSPEAWQVS
jgi:hypothetical protein